jgi:hypothetical protein
MKIYVWPVSVAQAMLSQGRLYKPHPFSPDDNSHKDTKRQGAESCFSDGPAKGGRKF